MRLQASTASYVARNATSNRCIALRCHAAAPSRRRCVAVAAAPQQSTTQTAPSPAAATVKREAAAYLQQYALPSANKLLEQVMRE
jgi:hypothetical protein